MSLQLPINPSIHPGSTFATNVYSCTPSVIMPHRLVLSVAFPYAIHPSNQPTNHPHIIISSNTAPRACQQRFRPHSLLQRHSFFRHRYRSFGFPFCIYSFDYCLTYVTRAQPGRYIFIQEDLFHSLSSVFFFFFASSASSSYRIYTLQHRLNPVSAYILRSLARSLLFSLISAYSIMVLFSSFSTTCHRPMYFGRRTVFRELGVLFNRCRLSCI